MFPSLILAYFISSIHILDIFIIENTFRDKLRILTPPRRTRFFPKYALGRFLVFARRAAGAAAGTADWLHGIALI
jgi:hypothetical protein